MMRSLIGSTCAAVLLAGLGGTAQADGIAMTFTLPPEVGPGPGQRVSWTALPLDSDAAAPVSEPGDFAGPWKVDLAPGTWLVSGAANDGKSYETIVQVRPGGETAFVVPKSSLSDHAVYTCEAAATCTFTDAHSGLTFALPIGWGADQPLIVEAPDGSLPAGPTVGFFQMDEEGGATWTLNPVGWTAGQTADQTADQTGPCRDIPLGRLCSSEETDAAKAAFAVIAPSLNWRKP